MKGTAMFGRKRKSLRKILDGHTAQPQAGNVARQLVLVAQCSADASCWDMP